MTRPTADQFVQVAAREIGEREGRNNDNKYGRYFDVNGTAWCAQFLCWVAEHAGADRGELFPNTAWCPTLLDFARDHDLIVIDPTKGDRSGRIYRGDIFLIQRPGQPNGAKHTGVVEKDLGDWRIQTIEGNTSTNGSAQGNGVYRLIRRMNNGLTVVFRPKYAKAPATGGGGGSKPPAGKTVDLSQLIAAAKNDPDRRQGGTTPGSADDVKIVEAALRREGLLAATYASDGSFGSATVSAYARWQRSKAGGDYEGDDADGIPGRDSLTRLGKRNSFKVRS